MIKSDLHCHTVYSDGGLTPQELVAAAAALGVEIIAVTDHDTMAGCDEAIWEGWRLGVKVVPGVEISAYDYARGRKVHLLAYNVQDRKTLEEACRATLESRCQMHLEEARHVKALGYPVDEETAMGYAGSLGILYRQHILRALMERGYDKELYGELNKKLFGKEGLAKATEHLSQYQNIFEAMRLVRETGGFPVLAHPLLYDSMELLEELAAAGLEGLEIWHSTHTPEENEHLAAIADALKLKWFGGTDFHGFYSGKWNPLGIRCGECSKINILPQSW